VTEKSKVTSVLRPTGSLLSSTHSGIHHAEEPRCRRQLLNHLLKVVSTIQCRPRSDASSSMSPHSTSVWRSPTLMSSSVPIRKWRSHSRYMLYMMSWRMVISQIKSPRYVPCCLTVTLSDDTVGPCPISWSCAQILRSSDTAGRGHISLFGAGSLHGLDQDEDRSTDPPYVPT
jgi:hypothetical protein